MAAELLAGGSVERREVGGEAPYCGVIPFSGARRDFRGDPLAFVEAARRKHGDFVRIRLDPYRVYLFLNPEYIRYLLQKNPNNHVKNGYEHNEPSPGVAS